MVKTLARFLSQKNSWPKPKGSKSVQYYWCNRCTRRVYDPRRMIFRSRAVTAQPIIPLNWPRSNHLSSDTNTGRICPNGISALFVFSFQRQIELSDSVVEIVRFDPT